MRHRRLLVIALLLASICDAPAAGVGDVPGAQVVQASIKSSVQRDQLARTSVTASLLSGIVYAQAGDRAKAKAFTPAESARMAELGDLNKRSEQAYEATLPPACKGHDCEERFAFYRCTQAYLFSSAYYRAVFDRFISPDAQKAFAPVLAHSGTVWQGALAMAANSHPFDTFPTPSQQCTTTVFAQPAQTAGGSHGSPAAAPAAAATVPAVPTAAFNAHADSIRRARAASVDVTVFGLTLGEPLHLPACPEQSLFDAFGPGISAMCISGKDPLQQGVESMAGAMGLAIEAQDVPFNTSILMPTSKCPDWMSGCAFSVALVDGRVIGVSVVTKGLEKQQDIAAMLVKKYKAASKSFWKEWTNDAGNKLLGLNMSWSLPGLNVEFVGYAGGDRYSAGSLLIETDAATQTRSQKEKARQDEQQKL